MKYIRYSRYTGEAADAVDLEELMKRLGDFLLQSGYESQYYGISEFDSEKTIEEGDMIPDELLEELTSGQSPKSQEQLEQLVDRLIERMMQEGYINATQPPQITAPPEKTPRGQIGGQRDNQDQT